MRIGHGSAAHRGVGSTHYVDVTHRCDASLWCVDPAMRQSLLDRRVPDCIDGKSCDLHGAITFRIRA
jgi:hypothetical protein